MSYLSGKDLIDTLIRDVGENVANAGYRLVVLSWLNQAIDETLTLLHGFKFTELRSTFDTVVDQIPYDFSLSGFYSDDILAMAVINPKRPLQYVDYFDLVRSGVDLTTKGQPKCFYFYSFDTTKHQSLVRLWPVPSSIETIEVYYSFSSYTIADDTSVIPLPKQIISIMMKYIKKLMYESENETDNSKTQYQEFLFMINEIKKQKTSKSTVRMVTQNDLKIPGGMGSGYQGFGFNSGLIGSLAGQTLAGVASISINPVQSFMTQSGSPVTSSGTIDLDWANQTGYKFLASPFDGTSGKPSFRKINAADVDGLFSLHSQNTDTGTTSTTWEINTGGSKLIISSSGLTSNRTFTYPDVSGKVLTNNSSVGDFPTLNQNTTGNALTSTTATTAANFSGSLAGDVGGTQSATVIGASKVTNSMLAGSIAYGKLSLTGTILNADLAGSIAYSKLILTTSIVNGDISASAAIAYSKLNLTGAIVNADLAGSITYSKLVLTGAILNADLAGSIAYSKLSLTGAILNADLAGSIAYSKLSLTGAILNADLAGSIVYSKLILTNSIVNADISSSAAIAYSKLNLTGSILNADLAGSIANAKLANSTISGISLGSNLPTLTIGTGLDGTSYNGSGAVTIKLADTAVTPGTYSNTTVTVDQQGRITSISSGAGGGAVTMGGDVTGASGSCTVTKINGVALGSTTATSANILVANGSSTWVSVAMSGDVTISNAGVTAIGSGKVTNAMLAGSIAYSKLSLTGAILNADLAGSIAYSKLSLGTSIVNADISASAAIVYSKLSLGTSIVNADISTSAAIAYSKLSLGTSIVNADISTSAAIAYSKLNLTGAILNADLAGSIAYSKLSLSNSIVAGDITANAVTAAKLESGTNGQLFIGNGTGFTKASLTSSGGSITITPGSGSIDLSVTTPIASPLVLAEFDVDGTNGALAKIKCVSVTHSISSSTTSTATNAIPAGALVLGVTTYNVSAIGSSGTSKIGDGTTNNVWGDIVGVASGNSSSGTSFLAQAAPKYYPSATSIIFTKSIGSYNGTGSVHIKIWYIDMGAPTS